MKIVLICLNPDILKAWKKRWHTLFNEFDTENIDIEFRLGDIVEYSKNMPINSAIVSPANSFGIMKGGIDAPIANKLFEGFDVENMIHDEQIKKFGIPITPVGSAVSVYNKNFKYYEMLISAPTMQKPKKVNDTINSFVSTYAALREAASNDKMDVDTLVMTAMGGATGGYTPNEVASQMLYAILTFYFPCVFDMLRF